MRKKRETEDKIYLPNRANPVNLGSDGRSVAAASADP
jgi:hypothetical protein